jgi:hypothetical protein
MTDQQTLCTSAPVTYARTHARREKRHAVYKMSRQIDENAEKPTPTDVLGDE